MGCEVIVDWFSSFSHICILKISIWSMYYLYKNEKIKMYFYYIGVSFPKVIFSYCWFCQVTRLQWLGSWGHSIDPLQRHFLFQAPFKVGGKKNSKSLSLSHSQLFATPWTVAYQSSLSMEILQERILEWVAISFSREPSWPRDKTCVLSCIGRWILYCWATRKKVKVTQSCPTLCNPMD